MEKSKETAPAPNPIPIDLSSMTDEEKANHLKKEISVLRGKANSFWKAHGSKITGTWTSFKGITEEVGKIENNNLFSKVNAGIKLWGFGKGLYTQWVPVKKKKEEGYPWTNHYNKLMTLIDSGLMQEMVWGLLCRRSEREAVENVGNHFVRVVRDGYVLFFNTKSSPSVTTMDPEVMMVFDKDSMPICRNSTIRIEGSPDRFWEDFRAAMVEEYGNCLAVDMTNGGIYREELPAELNSRAGTELVEKLKKYQEMGKGRTLMMYGPPGTGKTTIAHLIMRQCGKISISVKNMSSFDNASKYWTYLKDLQAEVVVFNDLDRVGCLDSLLDHFEILKRKGIIVVATVNKINNLDSALLRPGRFDKIVMIDKLEEELVLKLVDGDVELFDLCKSFSAASIEEMMVRVRVEGKDEAIKDLKDIQARDKRVKDEYAGEVL